MTETSVAATDLGALLVALHNQPALAPKPDALGNLQTIFRVKESAGALRVTHPDTVPASVIQTADSQVAAVIAARTAAAAAAVTASANEATIRDRLTTGLATADTHLANLAGTPTLAQQKAALQFAIVGLKQIARLELHQLTSAD